MFAILTFAYTQYGI